MFCATSHEGQDGAGKHPAPRGCQLCELWNAAWIVWWFLPRTVMPHCPDHNRVLAWLPSCAAHHCPECLVAERDAAESENERLRALLLRIRDWDHMDTAGDGAYWRSEINKALQSDLDGGVLKERHAKYPAKGKSRSLNDIVAEGLMELPSDVTMPQTPAAMARESALNAVIHSAQKRCACGDEDCGYDSDGMYQEPRIGSVSDLASTAGWEPVEYTVINEPWRQP